MSTYFNAWMHLDDDGLARLDLPEAVLVGLDPNRPHPYRAAGVIPQQQLDALERLLNGDDLDGRPVVLGLHHPPADRHGDLYTRYMHGLSNAADLVGVIERSAVRPGAILCGHVHHGFTTTLPLASGPEVPVFDCGSSGYAFLPDERRCASMCVYKVEAGAVTAERYQYDGAGFREEAGGAFASGR